ncbi:MAG: GtrA family protein [Vicinamibacterales bacterium]
MISARVLSRCGRFMIAGAPGFVVQIVTVAALTHLAGVHYLVATALGVEAAILCNFFWHERWTWRERPAANARERASRLLRFNLLTGATSIFGTVAIAAVIVEHATLPPIVANVGAVVILGLLNFAAADTLVFRAAAILVFAAFTSDAGAATLQSKTVEGFAKYAAAVEARSAGELRAGLPLIAIERQPPALAAAARRALKQGAILVDRGNTSSADGTNLEVSGGIINHWRGTIFIPNLALDTLLQTLKNPGPELQRQEDVVRSRVVSRRGADELTLYLRLKRSTVVTVVYDTEHDVRYRVVGPGRAVSSSIATRIVEVEGAETPGERSLPAGKDQGFLWRLNSYWRYQQADGGVLVELESLTLSRDIPSVFKPIVLPIIDRVARESMTRTLAALRAFFTS